MTLPETVANKRPVQIDDLYRYRLLADPQVSPDGRTVAYVQTRLRKEQNDYASNIWLVAADGRGEPRRFTASNKRDMLPRWSPDGKQLAFVSTRSGKPQLWLIPADGGEAAQLTRTKWGAGEFAWSPDGRWIVFASAVDSEADKKLASEKAAKAEAKALSDEEDGESTGDSENRGPENVGSEDVAAFLRPAGQWPEDEEDKTSHEESGDHAKVFTRLPYKSDGEGLVERHAHLYIVPAGGGKVRQLTDGDWDAAAPRWSPDGKQLAYLSNKEPDAGQVNINDIFVADVDEQGKLGEAKRITNHDRAIMAVDWLPDGGGFVVFGHTRTMEGGLATNPEVWRVGLDGALTTLSEGFDRPVGAWMSSDLRSGTGELRPRFGNDGRTVYFLVTNE